MKIKQNMNFDEFAEYFLQLPTQYCAFGECKNLNVQCKWRINGCCTAGSILPFGDYAPDIFDCLQYAESKCCGDTKKKRLFVDKLKQKNELYYQYFACEESGQYIRNILSINEFEKIFVDEDTPTASTIQPKDGTDEKPKAHFNCSMTDEELTRIFEQLKQSGFIASDSVSNDWLYIFKGGKDRTATAKIMWIAKNKRTRQANKKSLLDLLVLMGLTEKDIRSNINGCFTVESASNYASKDYARYRDWHKDIESEYHKTLIGIIQKAKQGKK